ncbi:MAG: Fic family protein [Christensenellaceae bacterium]|jgi:cell filamentation protein|nr:Fic family protein [Christensenellaceae bacterium]
MRIIKTSICFFDDREVRAVWDEQGSKWWFSALDVVGAINGESDYNKNRNYWKYLKAKIKKSGNELGSATTQLKLTALDGKQYRSDALCSEDVISLAKFIPNNKATKFLDWFLYSDNTIDGQSKKKAYTFWESNLIGDTEVGSVKALQKIHAYIFAGLCDFAGQIRTVNIAKGGFLFALVRYLSDTLKTIEAMPDTSFDEIVDKYVEMNVAHPFMDGNGRSTRLWLDLIFKRSLKKCVDWSKVGKKEYLDAMQRSVTDSTAIKALLHEALTDKINDREIFMKGVDYSYYYEQEDDK